MTTEYKTDLQIAQDLEKLSDTINHAVDYANRTLEEAKKVPELKQMLSKVDLTRTSIENASNVLVNINETIDSKVNRMQEIESHLKELKDLISRLNSIKVQSDRAEILLSQINPAYSSLQELSNELFSVYTLEKYLQKFKKCRNTKQIFRILWKDFGVTGIFIYLLICAIPKNSMIKSLFSKF
jgi:DNA repair ATPase RecN